MGVWGRPGKQSLGAYMCAHVHGHLHVIGTCTGSPLPRPPAGHQTPIRAWRQSLLVPVTGPCWSGASPAPRGWLWTGGLPASLCLGPLEVQLCQGHWFSYRLQSRHPRHPMVPGAVWAGTDGGGFSSWLFRKDGKPCWVKQRDRDLGPARGPRHTLPAPNVHLSLQGEAVSPQNSSVGPGPYIGPLCGSD